MLSLGIGSSVKLLKEDNSKFCMRRTLIDIHNKSQMIVFKTKSVRYSFIVIRNALKKLM